MEKTIIQQPTRKEDNKALLVRTLITFVVAVVFVVLLEFALYKFILPQIKETSTFAFGGSNYPEVFVVDKGETNFLYFKSENGAWGLVKNVNDSAIQGYKGSYTFSNNGHLFNEGAPSAFDLTINWVHYVVWGLMLGALVGYYVYWYIKIKKYYEVHPETQLEINTADAEKETAESASTETVNKFEQIDQEAMKKAKSSQTKKVTITKPATKKTTAKPKTTTKK